MLIKEFRIVLPLTVEEYQVGQLWSVAEASKNETGGGEGIEVKNNEPYDDEHGKGQYTLKLYHLASRVPSYARILAPRDALEFSEEARNAYPYCKTVVKNAYMKESFEISIETLHLPDTGESDNVHNLNTDELQKREVIYIDIANDPVTSSDYKEEFDPKKVDFDFDGRGCLGKNWINDIRGKVKSAGACAVPHMCAYKLVRCHFKWFGLQGRVESFIQKQERRLFTNFHRQVYCWMKHWHHLNMDDIRRIEDQTKEDLDEMRRQGSVKGTKTTE